LPLALPKILEGNFLKMHELSIARSLIEIACKEIEKLEQEQQSSQPHHYQPIKIAAVHIKIGALSGVVSDTLVYAYEIATDGTALSGSKLIVEDVPAQIYCEHCKEIFSLPTIQSFACPRCGIASSDLRAGRELDITALELID
jgi:hydrogenase nickel incorporation protein HypA/HybF